MICKLEGVKDFQCQNSDSGLMGVKWPVERHYFAATSVVGEPYHYFLKLLLFQLLQHCHYLMYYDLDVLGLTKVALNDIPAC